MTPGNALSTGVILIVRLQVRGCYKVCISTKGQYAPSGILRHGHDFRHQIHAYNCHRSGYAKLQRSTFLSEKHICTFVVQQRNYFGGTVQSRRVERITRILRQGCRDWQHRRTNIWSRSGFSKYFKPHFLARPNRHSPHIVGDIRRCAAEIPMPRKLDLREATLNLTARWQTPP
jgi:hypothetical protein